MHLVNRRRTASYNHSKQAFKRFSNRPHLHNTPPFSRSFSLKPRNRLVFSNPSKPVPIPFAKACFSLRSQPCRHLEPRCRVMRLVFNSRARNLRFLNQPVKLPSAKASRLGQCLCQMRRVILHRPSLRLTTSNYLSVQLLLRFLDPGTRLNSLRRSSHTKRARGIRSACLSKRRLRCQRHQLSMSCGRASPHNQVLLALVS